MNMFCLLVGFFLVKRHKSHAQKEDPGTASQQKRKANQEDRFKGLTESARPLIEHIATLSEYIISKGCI